MFTLNGIYVSLGIVIMLYITAIRIIKYRPFSLKYMFYMAPFAIASGFLVSRVSYVLLNDSLYLSNGEKWILTDGGYVLYGAFIGAIGAIYLWCVFTKKKKMFISMLDMLAPGAAVAIAVGRCGSAFYEECYGLYIENPALQKLPFSVYVSSFDSWCMAVFIYEAVFCLIIAVAVLLAEKIYAEKGAAIFHFLALYAGARAFLESLRMDSIYYGFVRISQLISLFVIVGLFVTMAIKCGRTRSCAWHIGVYIAFAASVVTGFLCEFYMGSSSYLQNYIGLGASCAVMTLMTLTVYGLNHMYSQKETSLITKKRRRKLI